MNTGREKVEERLYKAVFMGEDLEVEITTPYIKQSFNSCLMHFWVEDEFAGFLFEHNGDTIDVDIDYTSIAKVTINGLSAGEGVGFYSKDEKSHIIIWFEGIGDGIPEVDLGDIPEVDLSVE